MAESKHWTANKVFSLFFRIESSYLIMQVYIIMTLTRNLKCKTFVYSESFWIFYSSLTFYIIFIFIIIFMRIATEIHFNTIRGRA